MTWKPTKDECFPIVGKYFIIFCTRSSSSLNPLMASRLDIKYEK